MNDKLPSKIFSTGEIIFREGDRSAEVYLIKEGEVEISKVLKSGDKVTLIKLGDNSIFGEMAVIDQKPRSATATATRPTICYVISRQMFESKLARLDPMMRAMFRVVTNSLRRMTEKYPEE